MMSPAPPHSHLPSAMENRVTKMLVWPLPICTVNAQHVTQELLQLLQRLLASLPSLWKQILVFLGETCNT